MCGIYGFRVRQGQELTPYESTILTTVMAKEMEWRGKDSWGGVVFPHPNAETDRNIRIFKGVGPVTKGASGFFKIASNAQMMLAHTRAATVGKVSVNNSHPFEIGNVLGVHNGSVYNYQELNAKYNRKFEVDSQQVFAHIDAGLDLSEVEGQGTFFYSRKDEDWRKIYLARTSYGSLCLARLFRNKDDKDFFALVWASERLAVEKASELMGVWTREVIIKPDKTYCIYEDGDVYDIDKPFTLTTRTYNTDSKDNINRFFHGSAEWLEKSAEPFADNITTVFLVDKDNVAICPQCTCPLTKHSYGQCKQSHMGCCKVKKASDRCVNRTVKFCRDCGCDLSAGIHIVENGQVHCTNCSNPVCVPESQKASNTSKNDDPGDSDSDDTDTPPFNFLGKRTKKKLLKKAEKTARKEWETKTVDPLPNNIRPILSGPRATKGQGKWVSICKECICDLSDHIWGWCLNSGTCKSPIKEACHNPNIPLCRDCGHHMVEGIHVETPIHDKVIWCNVCSTYCCSSVDNDAELNVTGAENETADEAVSA